MLFLQVLKGAWIWSCKMYEPCSCSCWAEALKSPAHVHIQATNVHWCCLDWCCGPRLPNVSADNVWLKPHHHQPWCQVAWVRSQLPCVQRELTLPQTAARYGNCTLHAIVCYNMCFNQNQVHCQVGLHIQGIWHGSLWCSRQGWKIEQVLQK